jgi:hypothetical protein
MPEASFWVRSRPTPIPYAANGSTTRPKPVHQLRHHLKRVCRPEPCPEQRRRCRAEISQSTPTRSPLGGAMPRSMTDQNACR